MFIKFFYKLKEKGLQISMVEWLTLMQALEYQLGNCSLTDFYYLSRMILVKSETKFDAFDMAFLDCFEGIKSSNDISAQMKRWLDKPEMSELLNEERHWLNKGEDLQIDKEDVEAKFKERLKDQDSEHNGGSHWI